MPSSEFNNPISRLAVLIDADNTSMNILSLIMAEIIKFGNPIIKRAYGDWSSPNLGKWKHILNDLAILPIQQFNYTTGKNATDINMIIDAMDLLYLTKVDTFCLVSSDSDFTRLATRIRENGIKVIGFGRAQTPKSFIVSCDRFIYTENLEKSVEDSELPQKDQQDKQTDRLRRMIREAYDAVCVNDSSVNMGRFGQQLLNMDPSFDVRTFGYKKLSDLLQATNMFDIQANNVILKV